MITDRIASAVEVNDTDGFWEDFLDGIITSLCQPCILLHILLCASYRPEESMSGLIAHLYPFHVNVVILQKLERLTGMLCQSLTHLLILHLLPSLGDSLFARISPPVAVMEINHDGHTLFFGTKGQLQHILLTAEASHGVDPNTESGCIQPILTHQHCILSWFTLCIEELYAMSLQSRGTTDISSQPECITGRHRPYCCQQDQQ